VSTNDLLQSKYSQRQQADSYDVFLADVARFVTKAIDLPNWPPELRMAGERVTVHNLTILVQRLKSTQVTPLHLSISADNFSSEERFQPFIVHNINTLRAEFSAAAARQDRARCLKVQMMIATVEGRYDFTQRNLNTAFPGIQVERFANWFVKKWDIEQEDIE
jgi:hypothetical protein